MHQAESPPNPLLRSQGPPPVILPRSGLIGGRGAMLGGDWLEVHVQRLSSEAMAAVTRGSGSGQGDGL